MGCIFGKDASSEIVSESRASRNGSFVSNRKVEHVTISRADASDGERKQKGERRRSKPNPRLSKLPKHLRGEQVAAEGKELGRSGGSTKGKPKIKVYDKNRKKGAGLITPAKTYNPAEEKKEKKKKKKFGQEAIEEPAPKDNEKKEKKKRKVEGDDENVEVGEKKKKKKKKHAEEEPEVQSKKEKKKKKKSEY